MSLSVIVHLHGEDSVVGEIEELPSLTSTLVLVSNPRRVDGKDLHYLAENVVTVIWPTSRINFIEILSGKEDEEILSFVRE